MQVAHLQRQGHYLTVKDHQVVSIHPSSVIDSKPAWVVFDEFVCTQRNYVRTCCSTRPEWLIEMAPHYYDLANWPAGDTKTELERAYRRYDQEQGKKKSVKGRRGGEGGDGAGVDDFGRNQKRSKHH